MPLAGVRGGKFLPISREKFSPPGGNCNAAPAGSCAHAPGGRVARNLHFYRCLQAPFVAGGLSMRILVGTELAVPLAAAPPACPSTPDSIPVTAFVPTLST